MTIPTDRYDSTKRQLLLERHRATNCAHSRRRQRRRDRQHFAQSTESAVEAHHRSRRYAPEGPNGVRHRLRGGGLRTVRLDRRSRSFAAGASRPRMRRGAPKVAVVNEEMARRFWPGKEADRSELHAPIRSIYRVVGVTRTTKVRTLGEEPRPFIITSLAQEFSPSMMIVARTNSDADRTATQMLAAVREIDPGLMVIQVKTMERHLAAMLLPGSPGRDGIHAVRRTRARARRARRVWRRELRGRASDARSRHSSGGRSATATRS